MELTRLNLGCGNQVEFPRWFQANKRRPKLGNGLSVTHLRGRNTRTLVIQSKHVVLYTLDESRSDSSLRQNE